MEFNYNKFIKASFCFAFYILLQSFFPEADAAKPYHPVPTYFRRLHENGSIVDAKNPANQLDFKFITIPDHLDPNSVLKVSPSVVENGGIVNVSWSGVSSPNDTDFIALFCPITAESERYLDFFNVTKSPTWRLGYGQENSLRLWNMRSECEFRYYGSSKLVATSNTVTFRGGASAPLQGHLALTNTNSEMRVMWVSGTNKTPLVLYGLDKAIKNMKEGTSKTYSASDMCNNPASGVKFHDPGYIHDVLLTDLKPSMTYYYSYGSAEAMSLVYNFTSPPLVGSETKWTAAVYGDMGTSPAAQRIAQQVTSEVQSGNVHLVWHNGDIAYAEGYAYLWEQFFAFIEPYATKVPYMVGVGNHEQDHLSGGEKDPSGAPGEGYHPWWAPGYYSDSGGECGVPMFYRFHMPDNGNAVWWHSFNYGSIHFIMMSTEHNFTHGSRQYEWLENDLRNVNRSVTPWVIISGHRAMYTSQKIWNDYVVSLGMRHNFENLLHKYKVDLALWAHYHSYERTCALYDAHCVPSGGTVHIVVGTAGKVLDTEDYYPMNWSLYRENNFGYGRLTQLSRSSILWEWVESTSAMVKDKVLLAK